MRNYVMTTGATFGLLVLAHLARMIVEGAGVAKDPFFVLSTVASIGLCIWAVRLLRQSSRGRN